MTIFIDPSLIDTKRLCPLMETKRVTVEVYAMALLSNQVNCGEKRLSGLVVQYVSAERGAAFYKGVFEILRFFNVNTAQSD